MPSLKLRNDLEGENVKVKESNAGISRQIASLTPGQTYTLSQDPNATYREYILITLPNEKELPVLSTDLFHEWKEISIYKDGDTYDWRGSVRRHHPDAIEAPQASNTTSNGQGRFATVWRGFLSKFGL